MPLNRIQDTFQSAVYGQGTDSLSGSLLPEIQGPGKLGAAEGLAVYRNNTREALHAVLLQTFPVCAQLLDEACFRQLAALHLARQPSRQQDLEFYGAGFADTVAWQLETTDRLAQVPYLAELAHIEWLLHRAYYTADRRPFDFGALAQLNTQQYEHIRFQLAADVATVHLHWPLAELWKMHQPDGVIEPMELKSRHEYLVVERPQFRPQLQLIDSEMFELLRQIGQGASLQHLLAISTAAGTLLQAAVSNGWIEGFHVQPG